MPIKNTTQEPIIQVRNISKQYNIGIDRTYKTFAESFTNAVSSPIQTLKSIGHQDKTFWALKNINFNVNRGEVVGIIGRNGAGKSTLLKILSRITTPTEGEIRLRGRVGSLLEVGTGFHPELTGRENIYFNGAILGMKKKEIDNKFDEIVKFSEVEKFLDTPVKRYSSGMQVRLAFSVAANLDPEILVIDEVLAVGDAAFQKKCLGKMGDVAERGRTVLFVSHNMEAIKRLCQWSIRIEDGLVVDKGDSYKVVENYLALKSNDSGNIKISPNPNKKMSLREVSILDVNNNPSSRLDMGKPFKIRINYDVNQQARSVHVICFIFTVEGINVFGTGDADLSPERLNIREPGNYTGEFEVPPHLLGEGNYSITVSLGRPFQEVYDRHESVIHFTIVDDSSMRRNWLHKRRPGILGIEIPWKYY